MVRCLMMSDEDPLWPEVGGLGMGHGVHKSLVSLYSLRFHRLGFRLGRGSCILFSFFCFCMGGGYALGMQSAHQVRVRVRVRSRFALGRSNTWAGNWRWSGIDIGD